MQLTPSLSLVEGDLLQSQLQTLTIPVNTVGVMGKGLALQAKRQHPAMFEYYRVLCQTSELEMGQPYLYQSDPAPDEADTPWFLLFPTKRHWRSRSDLAGIEQGLVWLHAQYAALGIKSLALPALGCGLGGLSWQDVGPLMCRILVDFDGQIEIYLPWKDVIPSEQLSRQFLLGYS